MAIHAGWRGLANGIISKSLETYTKRQQRSNWLAWLGPAICPQHYTIGPETYAQLIDYPSALQQIDENQWQANLYEIAKTQLQLCGISKIYGASFCTFDDARFYSYRQTPNTGRFASLIYTL